MNAANATQDTTERVGMRGKEPTMMGNDRWEDTREDKMDRVHLAQLGVPPELRDDRETDGVNEFESTLRIALGTDRETEPARLPLLLTAEEAQVMLCFTLSSPLSYGSVEESLCEKLRRFLYGHYRFASAPAPEG